MSSGNIYSRIALSQVPRILGFGDRVKSSRTYGCFDRYYWHYKLIDFPNARFQEASLLLALLYKNNFEGNIYFNNPKIKEWGVAAIDFWAKARNKDGSVNEAYPNERGFCPTSFTTFSLIEASILLELANKEIFLPSIRWISKENNIDVSNQEAASTLAIALFYYWTKDEKYKKVYLDKLEKLLNLQGNDGSFPEYGGFDIGYETITLGILSKLYKYLPDKRILDALKSGLEFLRLLIEEDGTFNNSKTSRKTQYLYPYSFAFLSSDLIKKHLSGLTSDAIMNPASFDDRYVIPITTDYIETCLVMDKLP